MNSKNTSYPILYFGDDLKQFAGIQKIFGKKKVLKLSDIKEAFDLLQSRPLGAVIFETYQTEPFIGVNPTDLDVFLYYACSDESQNKFTTFLPIDPAPGGTEGTNYAQFLYEDLYDRYLYLLPAQTKEGINKESILMPAGMELLSNLVDTLDEACESLDQKLGRTSWGANLDEKQSIEKVTIKLTEERHQVKGAKETPDDFKAAIGGFEEAKESAESIKGSREDLGEDSQRVSGGPGDQDNDSQRVSGGPDEQDNDSQRVKGSKEDLTEDSQRIGGEKEDLSEDSQRIGGEKEDLSEDAQRISGEKEDLSEDSQRIGGEKEDLSEDAQSIGGEKEDLSEDAQSIGGEKEDLSEDAQRIGGEKEDPSEDSQRIGGEKEDLSEDAHRMGREKEVFSEDSQRIGGEKEDLSEDAHRMSREKEVLSEDSQRIGGEKENLVEEAQTISGEAQEKEESITLKGDKENLSEEELTSFKVAAHEKEEKIVIKGANQALGKKTMELKSDTEVIEDGFYELKKSKAQPQKEKPKEKEQDINQRNENGQTPLMLFAAKGDLDNIKALIEAGAKTDLMCHKGKNVVHYACRSKDGIDLIKYLVEDLEIKPTKRDSKGCDPLFDAILADNSEAIEYLVEQGAKLQSKFEGKTLLHLAAEKNRFQSFKTLLTLGMDPEVKDMSGKSVIKYCQEKKKIPLLKVIDAIKKLKEIKKAA